MSIDITTLALAKEYANRMVGSGGTGGGVNGKDGITPHIGDNGNWFIGTVDTGVSAQGPTGENGVTPHIGTNGNWYIGSVNTGVSAKGVKGDNGLDGNGIKSAILNSDYTLTLTFDNGTTYTTPSIRGATGDAGSAGKNGTDGKDGSDGVGIASIKQTTTSTADGGNNVFTVTLTNGTTATFTVKNGSKGSTGKDGSNGVDGGHYTPVVTQPTTDTMQISFAPSKSDMPAVNPVTVNLPVSENSGQNDNLIGYAKEAWVQEGFQPKGNYLTSAPITSVNGKTGAVQLGAADVGARPDTWVPTAHEVRALPDTYTPPNQTAEQVGADPKGTAAATVSTHNTSTDAHTDLRLEIKAIREQLAAFLDVDEETLNELSELIARIVANQTSIEQLTTGKVSVSDIIDNLTTNVANKPLSAAQGVALKTLIDNLSASLANYQPKGNYALASAVPTKVSQLANDKGYLTEHQDISHLLPSSKIGVLSPDNYAGTDTQKLQSCLDAVKTAGGGIIAINRLYTLTGDLFVELESGKTAQIMFLGIGQNAGINFKTYKFTSTTNRNNGNLLFDGMNLYGTAVGFDFDNLIRAKFSNCTISGFANLVCSTTYIQTLHMVNCQIRRTAGAVIKSGKTTGDTSASAGTVMDMHITGCLIEWCAGLLDTYGVSGSSIIGCCIEGFSGTPIVVTGYASGMVIDGNYWEKNGNGINIDLSSMTGECQLTISNNSFSEYYNQAAGIVHLPSSIAGGILQITGNKAAAYEVLLYVPDDAIDLRTTVWAFANGGSARDPNSALKTTEPYDLVRAVAKADEVFELTDTDKEKIVNDTLAALSGEEWEFTMDDGSVVKRTVATAHLTDFNQEGWDFVLTDGTIISKVVATA